MIRYDKKINNEIQKLVTQYNAKITRLSKKGEDVPEKIKVKDIKKEFTNRRDLKYYLKDLSEFTKRGSTVIGKSGLPKYQEEIIKRGRRRLRSTIAARRKKAIKTHATTFGVPSTLSMAEEFNIDYLRLEALEERFLESPIDDVERFIRGLRRSVASPDLSTWQTNYTDMILDVAYTYGIPHNKIHEFRERLVNLSPKQFDNLLKNERSLQSIVYYYKNINDVGVDIAYEELEGDVVALFNAIFEEEDNILKEYET